MDINNIQALIAQGLLTDVASVDPNKAYVAVGVFQPGNRQSGPAGNAYPSYAMPISEFLAAGGVYTASNGIALVGNDFQLASLNISQFTNDSNYVAGTGTIGYIPRWDLTDTLGNSVIFDDGLGKVGISTITPSEKLEVNGNIKLTTLANKYKIGAYDALSITQRVGSPNIIIGHGNTMNDASNGGGIVIGTFATSSSDGIAIGLSSVINVGTEDCIAIGRATVIAGSVIRGLAIGREATSTADNAWAIGNYVVANTPDTIIFGTNTAGNKQKVGIGTTNPNATLHIKGDANAGTYALKVDNLAGVSLLSVRNDGNIYIGSLLGSYKLNMVTDVSNMALFETNQSVGSVVLNAVSNPSYKLLLNSIYAAEFGVNVTGTYIDKNGTLTLGSTASGGQWTRFVGSGTDIYIGQSAFSKFGYSSGSCSFIEQDANTPLGIGTISNQDVFVFTNNTIKFTVKNDGNVGIGTASPATSALLDLTSTTGSLLVPRMTTTQKNALTPANGMIVYDSTLDKFQGYEAGAWANLI